MSTLALETDSFREGFGGKAGPAWLQELRQGAMERFSTLGFPTTKDEAWKYTSVAPITRRRFSPAPEGRVLLTEVGLSCLGPFKPAVFVNGRFVPELSSAPHVRSLRAALANGGVPDGALGTLQSFTTDAFAALNTAFLDDGALVVLPKGQRVEEPIVVLHLSTSGGGEATISHPRTLVLAGEGSEATLVEAYAGRAGDTYFTNSVTEVRLSEGGRLDHVRVQLESSSSFHVERLAVRQERSTRYSSENFCLGAGLSRSDLSVLLSAPGAECDLNGLFMTRGEQHADFHTSIVHAEPHGSSRELFKGILGGRSRGVFAGTIRVAKDAQKTDARQTNRNLLLSSEALVDSVPRLEILADDVKCKHGSATGQLDPKALFYLRSRGIGCEEARSLLVYAFGQELVQRVKVEPLRRELERELASRLTGVQS